MRFGRFHTRTRRNRVYGLDERTIHTRASPANGDYRTIKFPAIQGTYIVLRYD